MKARLLAVAVVALLGLGLVPAGASADPATGRLLVGFEPGVAARTVTRLLSQADVVRDGPSIPQLHMVTVRPPAGVALAALIDALRGRAGIRYVQAEHRMSFRAAPNDPALTTPEATPGAPAGTLTEWWAQPEGLLAAWNITHGTGATVAVVDSGIDGGHPEFAGKIAEGIDLDGTPGHGPPTGDESGHGTHVAGLACAATNNGIGIAGTGGDCKLIVIKSDLTDGSVAAAIVAATDRHVGAINMSFGSDGSTPTAQAVIDAVNRAWSDDIVMVAAAADSPGEEQGDPADLLQPTGTGQDMTAGKGLTVTAANLAGARASFAGSGSQISMAAYGQLQPSGGPMGLLSTFPGNSPTDLERGGSLLFPSTPCNCRTTFMGDSRYAYLQGTSMAAPMVAGAAALIRNLNPDLHAADVIRILKDSATRPSGSGWTPELGWGILNEGAAVTEARAIDRRAPTSRLSGPKRVRAGGSLTLRWRGHDATLPGLKPSGIKLYDVYRATGHGRYARVAHTRRTRVVLHTKPGARYRFYTRAIDKAGNVEAVPSKPDLAVRVGR